MNDAPSPLSLHLRTATSVLPQSHPQSQKGRFNVPTSFARSDYDAVEALDAAATKPDQTQLLDLAKEAARSESIPALEYAISLGAQPSQVIIPALSVDNPDVLACLLDAGLDINYRIPGYTGTPLTGASAFAKVELVKSLLARGADPSLENCGWGQFHLRPLAAAAQGTVRDEDAADVMKVLLDGGARCRAVPLCSLRLKRVKWIV